MRTQLQKEIGWLLKEKHEGKRTPAAKKDETAGWKTFTGQTSSEFEEFENQETVKFSFRHPTDFREIGDVGGTWVSNDQEVKSLYDNITSIKTPGSVAAQTRLAGPKPSDFKNAELGGKMALKSTKSLNDGKVIWITYYVPNFVTNEGNEVALSFDCTYVLKNGVNSEKTCDLMVSTFKFLD